MSDGMASIQARIQAIQERFVTPSQHAASTSSTGATATSNQAFADLLSAASTGADGTSTGTGTGTSALTSLLANMTKTATGTATSTAATGSYAGSAKTQTFLQSALAQAGDPYVWGATASPTDPNPTAFDCSELVKWAAKRAGVDVPDGSWYQYLQLKQQGATIPVQQALQTPGALLFSFSQEPTPGGGRPSHAHVAISLGNGKTIEARGSAYGVGSFDAANRFQYGAIVPGFTN